jgi:hypothetical protein
MTEDDGVPRRSTGESTQVARARREREDKATKLAIETALERQRVDLKLQQHADDIRELQQNTTQLNTKLDGVAGQLRTLSDTLPKTISDAIQGALAKQSNGILSSRASAISIGLLVVAVVALVVSLLSGHPSS